MIKNTQEWADSLRQLSLEPNSPVQQKDGRWKVSDRLRAWKTLGPRIFDPHLERLLKITVEVLRESDPQFELQPDQRFAASLHGKVLTHSHRLRKGLAETMALLGSYPEVLTSCSHGKAENTARSAVRMILHGANWELWASLNDVLPFLAEAAPEEFLGSVEEALNREPSPIDAIFAQEGPGFSGSNYMTGLLWALETLAWDDQYLIRVIMILGGMAAKDPGGNWANRPSNSISTILLPWFPQTLASIPKRRAAVATLQTELPAVAWKLLVKLLPRSHQSSSDTRKPTWRRIIPDDWKEGATQGEYWEQVEGYTELAIGAAKLDSQKLDTLVGRLNDLPSTAREQILLHLQSPSITSLPQEQRASIWTSLTSLVARHRKFAKAPWALGVDQVEQIAAIATHLEPESATLKYQRLFTERETSLYESTGNYQEQRQKLDEGRRRAVEEVYSEGGIEGTIKFAEEVESASKVGFAFGQVAGSEDENQILPKYLESDCQAVHQFTGGFILGRFQLNSWDWVDHLNFSQWTGNQKALLLAYLPFMKETWTRANQLLGADESLYWEKTHANAYQAKDDLEWAIDRLVDNGRVNAAIDGIEKLFYTQQPIDPNQVVRILKALRQSPEAIRVMDPHAVTQLIKILQENPETNQDELFKIEWEFLALLDGSFETSPTLLEKTLAQNPDFFCQVIRVVFRSDHTSETREPPSETQQAIANNAYHLLRDWRVPPGTQPDGSFNGSDLNEWLAEVKRDCAQSGHLKIAMEQVGEVLLHSPKDPDGLWLHKAAASVLNEKDADDLRRGYEVATFNSRGVHWVDPQGGPERELAKDNRRKADDLEFAGYFRVAATLREIAASYDREADRNVALHRSED